MEVKDANETKPADGATQPDGKPPASGQNQADPQTATAPDKTRDNGSISFTAEQQEFFEKRIAQARKEGREAAENKLREQEAAAAKERERAEAESKGQYESVKQSLTQELDTAKATIATYEEQIERYETIAKERNAELEKSLPAEALADLPVGSKPIDKLAWLEARVKLVKSLMPVGDDGKPRLPTTPEGDGKGPSEVSKEDRAAFERTYRRF